MIKVASGQGGPIKWALDFQGPALDLLVDKNRNELVRTSFANTGKAWNKIFLPKRFGHYVDRPPFPYPRHRLGFFLGKARRMGILRGIIARLTVTKGWDPWSTDKPPFALIQEWKKLNPGKYKERHSGSGLIADMRRNAKRAVMEVIDEMWSDGKFLPLVQSGVARAFANEGAKARATATTSKTVLKISVPFGHPVAESVGSTVRTIPPWEVQWLAQQFAKNMIAQLKGKGLSVGAGGVVTTRAPTGAAERSI